MQLSLLACRRAATSHWQREAKVSSACTVPSLAILRVVTTIGLVPISLSPCFFLSFFPSSCTFSTMIYRTIAAPSSRSFSFLLLYFILLYFDCQLNKEIDLDDFLPLSSLPSFLFPRSSSSFFCRFFRLARVTRPTKKRKLEKTKRQRLLLTDDEMREFLLNSTARLWDWDWVHISHPPFPNGKVNLDERNP